MGGRVLAIKPAVKKDEAEKLAEEGAEKRAKKRFDKRHTHLAYEGNIRPGTDVAAAMPASDLAKREAAAKEKKVRRVVPRSPPLCCTPHAPRSQEKLKSPLFFVSPLRLSVRNLSRSVDDATLRLLCIKATTAGKCRASRAPLRHHPHPSAAAQDSRLSSLSLVRVIRTSCQRGASLLRRALL